MSLGRIITFLGILLLVLALVFQVAAIAASSLLLLVILGALAVGIGQVVG